MSARRWRRREVLATTVAMLAARVVGTMPVGAAGVAPLYARPTGHTIPAEFRTLWESLGGPDGLGWPLDEAQPTKTGMEQWFQYGRIYQNMGGLPALATVGRESAQFRSVIVNPAFGPKPPPLMGVKLPDTQYAPISGHFAANGFLTIWSGKQKLLGAPISEEFAEGDTTVQYFENGRLELDPTANNAPRVTMIGVVMHGPAAPAMDAPAGVDFIGDAPITSVQGAPAHDGHWLLINLAQQHLWAYDGTMLVRELDVSTGLPGTPTPPGSYWIQQRFRSQEMIGPGYDLPGVPFVQYFGNDQLSWGAGYSFHGTYWHHNWGHPMSHGCVNLPTDFAEWLWDWAGIGTPAEIIAG